MKTKGFTLTEMLVAMSLMGLVLVGGGKLYHHLHGMVFLYQNQQESSFQTLQTRRVFHQDILQSIAIQELTDTSLCLMKHVFEAPICYVKKDSFWVRRRAEGEDTLVGDIFLMKTARLMYN